MKVNAEKILELVDAGYLIMNKHPEEDLFILNYSKTTQYEQYWNEYTIMCRGLVVDVDFNVVGRCLPKFFNLEEPENKGKIPKDLPFEVYEKMDGSLILVFHYNGGWIACSRGSFTSDQAVKAGDMLKMKNLNVLDTSKTYMFEILYKSNRIVVDYGDTEDLVLLATIDTETGEEESYEEIVELYSNEFTIVKKYDELSNVDLKSLHDLEENNREGFVIKYSNGFRVKVKFKEYVRLHRILTNVSSKSIWEALKSGDGLDDIVDAVLDEMYQWVKETKRTFLVKYMEIERDALKEFHRIYIIENRTLKKDFALIAKDHKYSGILFKLYDGKTDYKDYIWKMLKPTYEKPFSDNADDVNEKGLTL